MQTNLDLEDARAQAFLEERFPGAAVLTVPLERGLQSGQCYNNVAGLVSKFGGEIQLCWLLTWFPDHYIEALHHAIWKKRDGTLVDVTAKAFPAMDPASASIILDNETKFTFPNPAVPSKVLQLDEWRGTADFLDLLQKQMLTVAEKYALLRKLPLQTMNGQMFVNGAVPSKLPTLEREIKRINDRLGEYDRRFAQGKFQKLH